MKNKLLIMVLASCSLIAIGSVSWAGGGLPTMPGPSTFSTPPLVSPQMATCGDGTIDEGEQCEFKDGVEITVPMDLSGAPVATCSVDFTCNPQTCLCEQIPICGDGIFAGKFEQCEAQLAGTEVTPENIDKMCVRVSPLTLLVPSWFTPPPLAEGAHYVCNDCMCETCGNGVIDPGEECDGTPGCNSECKLTPLTPPVVEKIKCSIKEYGALDAEVINEWNRQGNAIIKAAYPEAPQIDLFGQELYSKMIVQFKIPNKTFPPALLSPSEEPNVVKSGDVYMTSTGIVLLAGPVPNALSTMVMRPHEHLEKPLYLFPRVSGAAQTAGKSVVGGKTILVPDLSASFSGLEIETDLSAAGLQDTNLIVVGANEASLNGVVRFMIAPSMPTTSHGAVLPELGSLGLVVESIPYPAPPGWTGGGDEIEHDPIKVLAKLEQVVNQLKAEGREDEIDCGIAMKLSDVPYEPQMFSRFAVVSDTVKINSTTGKVEMAEQQVMPFAYYSVITDAGFGGRATSTCSLTGVQAHVPQILVSIGMWLASLAGIGIIRRRKK